MRRACILRQACEAKPIDFETIRGYFASGDYVFEDTVQRLTCGVKGIRRPDDEEEWAEFEELENGSSDDEDGAKGRAKEKKHPRPTLSGPLELWLPAVLVKEAVPGLVEAYEVVQKQKEERKAGKGGRVKTVEPKAKPPRSVKPKLKAGASTTTLTAKPYSSQLALRNDQVINLTLSDDDMDYDNRPFILSRPVHSITHPQKHVASRIPGSTLPDLPFNDHSPSTASVSALQKLEFSEPSAQDNSKKKAMVSQGTNLLSIMKRDTVRHAKQIRL
ncbi:hypothetical protein C8J55DRAFT_490349 [Lentinula edodes]|uniref:Holliday junction resolvase Gen1 C-terminal domain-containing protein n=1 Tax=Lentinula lateritia TaxID=40482 RepID=A0A9W9A7C0_9AGAR|nr:hypothetical protein C8J55DRAFT_490349 [Lentinula edodes]